jgi:hypothetical protein
MQRVSVASFVRRHVRLHSARRAIELFDAGESFDRLIEDMTPEVRRSVEGLLRAAAESWGNAVAERERLERDDARWLR